MVFIFDNKIEDNVKVVLGLSKIYGIGYALSKKICGKLGVSDTCIFKNLNQDKIRNLVQLIIDNKLKINMDLKRNIRDNLHSKVRMRTFQGTRHIYGLPVNGQRSKTNGRSAKRSWTRKLVNDM